jgi:hypothetical protein
MKTTYRALSILAILALVPLALAAAPVKSASAQGPYNDVYIVVKDLNTNQEVGTVQPGGTLTLPEGARVRLILTATAPGRGKGPAYPETEFTELDPGRGWVRVTRTNVENANATLEIVNPHNPNRSLTESLRYRIVENIGIPNALRQGTVTIRVEPSASSASSGSAPVTATAQGLTNLLYRAILLRDFDPSGQPYVDRIARGGYPELVRVAQEIAQSDESRSAAYDRAGRSNEQRLLTLYQSLLGLSSGQIDRDQWNADLKRLNDGRLADVVLAMVRSERFQDVHNLNEALTSIRY